MNKIDHDSKQQFVSDNIASKAEMVTNDAGDFEEYNGPDIFDLPTTQFLISVITVLVVSMLPMIVSWSANASGLDIMEGLFPVLLSLFVGCVVYFSTWFVCKRKAIVSGLVGSVIVFALLSFGLFNTIADLLIPNSNSIFLSLVIAVIICGGSIYVIFKTQNNPLQTKVLVIICITCCALFLYNACSIVRPAIRRVNAYKDYEQIQSPSAIPPKTNDADSIREQPNIYYFILDECADFYTMEKYYGIPQNENPFFQYLLSRGFNVSTNSYSYTNRSVYTMANAFSLEYVCTENTTSRQARIASYTGKWFDCLRDMGYSNYQVSSHTTHYLQLREITKPSFFESILCSVTEEGATILDMMLEGSILSLIIDCADEGEVTFVDEISASFFHKRLDRVAKFYADPSNYTFDGPIAIHSYFLPPHTPFFCDAEGNTTSISHRCDWVNKDYYRNQYLFMVKYMQSILDNILKYDPSAIIIVQSDHGIRGGVFTGESLDVDLYDQCRILNAVYVGGEIMDISDLSAVNTLRSILNDQGLDFEAIEDPNFIFWQDQLDD